MRTVLQAIGAFPALVIAKVLSGRLRGVLHETIHSTQGEEGVVFKIDFEKAYDHVNWDFLDHMLEKKGFSPKWRNWMRDVLSRMMLRAEEKSMLKGFKVNLDKSNLFGINLDHNHLSRLALLLDCKASDWPILYLGLLLGGNPIACGFWDLVIERISRRLDGFPLQWLQKLRDCKGISFGQGLGKVREIILLVGMQCVILSIYGTHSNGWDANTLVRWSHRCPWKAIAQVYRIVYSQVLLIALSEMPDLSPLFSTKFVWNSQIPFKVKSFVWLVAHKKVNTNDLLQLRRPYKTLSPDIFSQDGLGSSRSISDMMSINYKGFGTSKRGIVLWQNACITLIWVVWQERNARYLRIKFRNSENLWDSIHFLAPLWAFCSVVFKGIPFNVLQIDWLAVCSSNGMV
ncbi:hypothetical protein CK203_039503 [Vitis vinifera]|uniref:Reverse transcriptase zinc-binding domain-containing protein n=1 Tax=Vitis vinifera TaxID=29760 RepID=A0A438HKK2_VITVI|nr:hypothetical protein CK203_039503 [Vitis vinifera]